MHKFWNFTEDNSGRTLRIEGQIADETWFGDEVTPQVFKNDLHAGNGDITLWINSPGGDVFAAAQIYNMLMDYKGDVHVVIDGLAASAASVIAMAGTTVSMSPVAMMMIHNPWTVAQGEAKDMQKVIEMLGEIKESIINAYELRTGLSRTKLSHLMDSESWFNAIRPLNWALRTRFYLTAKKNRNWSLRATHSVELLPNKIYLSKCRRNLKSNNQRKQSLSISWKND